MKRYKKGDRVKIKQYKDEMPSHWNDSGEMDYLIGKVVTISVVDHILDIYYVEENLWCWKSMDFEEVEDNFLEDKDFLI